jgi:hypothetical protein
VTDIVSLKKDCHRIEHLGLTLADSKQLLKLIQKKRLQQQIDRYLETHFQCSDCDTTLKTKRIPSLTSWRKRSTSSARTSGTMRI